MDAQSRKTEEAPAPTRYARIIVVHNFKTTLDIEQFKAHRTEYVEDCYVGTMRKEKVTVKGVSQTVEFFQNELGDMTHLFLARSVGEEDCPAAAVYNGPTVEYLKILLQAMPNPKREPLLARLCDEGKKGLGNFFAGLRDVGLFYRGGQILLKARPVDKGHLKLLADEVIYDGSNIFIARPDDFKLHVDVLETPSGLIVLVDMPGVPSQDADLKDSGCTVDIAVDKRKHELIITGIRSLYLRRYSDVENRMPTNSCLPYDKEFGNVQKMERKYGQISKRVKIPEGFSADLSSYSHLLEHGQLQILIPKDVAEEKVTLTKALKG